jgi:HPt (histidine-containing phosphotransfer) domain-containing protein
MAEINGAIREGNADTIRHQGHSLKGGATFGARPVCDAAEHLEDLVQSPQPDWQAITDSAHRLGELVDALLRELRQCTTASGVF